MQKLKDNETRPKLTGAYKKECIYINKLLFNISFLNFVASTSGAVHYELTKIAFLNKLLRKTECLQLSSHAQIFQQLAKASVAGVTGVQDTLTLIVKQMQQ